MTGSPSAIQLFATDPVNGAVVTEAKPTRLPGVPAAQVTSQVVPAIPMTNMPESIANERFIGAWDQLVTPGRVAQTGGRPMTTSAPAVVVASNAINFQDDTPEEIAPPIPTAPVRVVEAKPQVDMPAQPAVVKEAPVLKQSAPVDAATPKVDAAESKPDAKVADKDEMPQSKEKDETSKDGKSESDNAGSVKSAVDTGVMPAPAKNGGMVQPLAIADAVRLTLAQNKSIMVLGYVPQEVGTFVSTERAVFDPVFEAGIRGGQFDRQYRNFINTGGILPGGFSPGANEQRTDFLTPASDNNLSISKLLETGGTVEAGILSTYIYDNPVGNFTFLNPAWGAALNFNITQPLGRDMGREVTTAPLRIAQANQSVAAHDFQALINETLRDVQIAYWDWKLAQRDYLVTQQAVETALKTVELEKEAVRLGEGTLPDLEQATDQWQRFKVDEAVALNAMKKARISLIQLMGLPINDIGYDFAIDEPTPYVDFSRELGEASAMARPEIMALQSTIRATEIEVKLAANSLRPDIDMRLDYNITGLESDLDDAIKTVSQNRFQDWIVQLEYRRAAGQRAECASLRRSRLRLARAIAEQDRIQQSIAADVARTWEDLMTSVETLRISIERVETAKAQVTGRDELFTEGEGSLDLKIRAEASLVQALLTKQAAEIEVQQQIVRWQYVTNQQQYVQFTDQ